MMENTHHILIRIIRVSIFIFPFHARHHVGSEYCRLLYNVVKIYGIRGCKISDARSGGVTHFAITDDEDGSTMTVAWGQNATNGITSLSASGYFSSWCWSGELGLGPDEPKSATKPTRNQPLNGIDVFRWVLLTRIGRWNSYLHCASA